MRLSLSSLRNRLARLIQTAPARSARVTDGNYDAAIRYLLDEVSDLRVLVRELAARASIRSSQGSQTQESFSYQWKEIPEGAYLVGDPQFERTMTDLVTKYADRPADWFAGKSILDAGCGNGRWSYAFAKLGAEVVAVDQSECGVANLSKLLAGTPRFRAQQADVLDPLPFGAAFDLVWCYGVAHHTGDTRRVVENVAAAVKPRGRLFLMIYGEPTNEAEFGEINGYNLLRRQTQFMTFAEKVEFLEARFPKQYVHGYFDAISPAINDLHRFDEVEGWLRALGFENVRKTHESRNHHLVADRAVC